MNDDWMYNNIKPVFKFQGQINKAFNPLICSQISLQKPLKPLLDFTITFDIPKYVFPNFKPLGIQSETIIKPLKGAFDGIFEELQQSLKELKPKTREALILLGMHGWYLDLKMSFPFILDLKKSIEEGDTEYLDNSLVEYFKERLDEIEVAIVRRFPNREKVIKSAINAHRRTEYELSIPVLLSQADGICKEVANEHFFIKKDRKPGTAIYVQDVTADTFRAALLSPLSHNLPICMSEKERDTGFNELNRHMVLHGESLNYGTKINSLKTISFINYVAQILRLDSDS